MGKKIIKEYEELVELLSNKEDAYIQVAGKYTAIIHKLFDEISIIDPDPDALQKIKDYQDGLQDLFNHHFKKVHN